MEWAPSNHDGEVRLHKWALVICPEDFCIDSLVAVHELFEDLWDIGLEDQAQYPTLVLYREDDGMSA